MTLQPLPPVEGLFYPFHLCHENTLLRLLNDYDRVHFKDFLSIQLTPMVGTTAFLDQMGDYYPEFLTSGQIVQGYSMSGPLSSSIAQTIDEDLVDPAWRKIFHLALQQDSRFQKGLFDLSQEIQMGKDYLPEHEFLLELTQDLRRTQTFSVKKIQSLSATAQAREQAFIFDYGFSLLKTSASLAYTHRLASEFDLHPVTDSLPHFLLLQQTFRRAGHLVVNKYLSRHDY